VCFGACEARAVVGEGSVRRTGTARIKRTLKEGLGDPTGRGLLRYLIAEMRQEDDDRGEPPKVFG
jgi:hypothetical protein